MNRCLCCRVLYGNVQVQGDSKAKGKGKSKSKHVEEKEEPEEDAGLYNETTAGKGLDPVDSQYQTAIRQVVSNMDQSTNSLDDDADKIGEASRDSNAEDS